MQIGDSIYLDLEIKGSDKKNFLSFSDALDFQIIETAGASLPMVYAKFIQKDPEITNLFQENNIIKVKLGSSEKNCDTFNVQIMKPNVNNDPSGTHQVVEFIGYMGNLSYMVDKVSKVYKGRSLHVVNKVIKEKFGKIVQTTISDEKEESSQWQQNNQTCCTFVADVLLHADLRPSFPMFSFDKYCNFKVLDLDRVRKDGYKYTFVPHKPFNLKEIKYFNNFNVESYSTMYNMYSGFDKMTEIQDLNSGTCQPIIDKNVPILGSSREIEALDVGNTSQMNVIQSANVHPTYCESFTYNTNKLMSLSSMIGSVHLMGRYYRDLHPLDLVNVRAGISEKDTAYDGLYLIDTIVTRADFSSGTIHTYVYVTRDNKNNVENYIAEKKQFLKILQELKNKILSSVADLKRAYAFGLKVIDGTYMRDLLSYAIATKTNILRSFSALGVTLDLNSQKNALISLICMGNNLMNLLCDMLFPENVAAVLHDFIISERSLKSLLSSYIGEYVPVEVRDIVAHISELLFDTTDSLNSIAKDNGITVTSGGLSGTTITSEGTKTSTSEDSTTIGGTVATSQSQQRVNNILSSFEENTSGVDIPFPVIELTESQELYSDEQLKEYIATETINNLSDLGYMNGVDSDELKSVLLGESKITFELIKAINNSAGNNYSYRYYGTFNSEIELVDYYIKKGFKDKYRTLPCTKLINATQNARIFFACPSREDNVKIYINSKRTDVPSFEIDLGIKDETGATIKYTVYYTEDGYNSNSVLFEVKQGGMV